MSESIDVISHKGPYTVFFDETALTILNRATPSGTHYIIDKKVAGLYKKELSRILASGAVLLITADEKSKSLDRFPRYVEHLIAHGIRRNHKLIAIGGGVIQDITCFLAATLLRGVKWYFYPTTLLAQTDSCIGSKSSINVGKTKNILGTFTPPERIYICTHVLKTLEEREVLSGVGEMLKVHAIDGPGSFDRISSDYEAILSDSSVMKKYIYRSLKIKKAIIELDEFDKGPRNVMNYGHSFGHAIESVTNFSVPHGIAVCIGMDMANFVAVRLNLCQKSVFERMHPPLRKNFAAFKKIRVPLGGFISALSKDKKNTDDAFRLVLPDKNGKISLCLCPNNSRFQKICGEYLINGYRVE